MSGSCDANLRWLHLRLRLAGFRMRGLRKASEPAHAIKVPECFEIGAREDFGRYMQRLDERLRCPDTHGVAPVAKAIGTVLTYGLDQLDANAIESMPDIAACEQSSNGIVGVTGTGPIHGPSDFAITWATAMGREMGAEELEKFALTLRDPDHGIETK